MNPLINSIDEAVKLVEAKYHNLTKRIDGPRDIFDPENQKLMELNTIKRKLIDGRNAILDAEKVNPDNASKVASKVKLDLLTHLAEAKTSYGVSHINTPMSRLLDGVLSLVSGSGLKTDTANVIAKVEILLSQSHR